MGNWRRTPHTKRRDYYLTNLEACKEFFRQNPEATNQEAADAIGVGVASIPRYLRQLEKDGVVKTVRRRVEVLA